MEMVHVLDAGHRIDSLQQWISELVDLEDNVISLRINQMKILNKILSSYTFPIESYEAFRCAPCYEEVRGFFETKFKAKRRASYQQRFPGCTVKELEDKLRRHAQWRFLRLLDERFPDERPRRSYAVKGPQHGCKFVQHEPHVGDDTVQCTEEDYVRPLSVLELLGNSDQIHTCKSTTTTKELSER